ncbi:MAG: class I SAM-dependent methyltransferase [Candidatus Korarchaeum sp.]|nr:class I SAM-dependent methyltransferase [Candidatus Korarchaeum sp.]MDW8036330.1 class I SAM-dependent methyltransferase [Candidatus Korarchaeum sp.]
MSGRRGLEPSEWNKVIEALERTIERYELVNRLISLGYSGRMRRKLAEMALLEDGMVILDAGCGPGLMSELLLSKLRRAKLYCLDPLPSMLKAAFDRLKLLNGDFSLNFIESTFEQIPLVSSSVDLIAASYSLRDARDFYRALEEFRRVLKVGGQLLVVEVTKPDSELLARLGGTYLKHLVPLISAVIYGSLKTPWKELYPTYESMMRSSEFIKEIGDYFEVVEVKKGLFGIFTALRAVRF